MNKVLVLLMVAFAFIACSSDSDSKESNPDGRFVAHNGTILLMAEFDNGKCWRLTGFKDGRVFGKCWRLTGFKDGRVFGQCSVFSTTGQYPNYTCAGDGFSMICKFVNSDNFEATISGQMPGLYGSDRSEVAGTYSFSRFSGVLDANGDGIIDAYP